MVKKSIPENIVQLVMYAIALAMGIVSVILTFAGQPVDLTMIAIGMTTLAIAGLDHVDKHKKKEEK